MFGITKIFYSLIFFANSLVILNEMRFLAKLGLPLKPEARGSLSGTRRKIVDLLRASRTLLRIPLIFINLLCILYEVFLG
ncbi:putative Yos1-like protein transport protein [Hamiltosporidium tvaerminnensis]|uniref:Putative Yos1-like protein transport protein n=1 Tax=Hamiltosporidium tvaerminnensis TaxID=1176355 RepID=A0A4Q9LVE4_9MICR|nr:putative Yos1-like protein transport protein [Hamiltosporidium tvaerminnensis]